MQEINFGAALSYPPPTSLLSRCARDRGLTVEETELRFRETLKFLVLCALNPDAGYSPSREIDDVWHEFILHTKQYAEFCELVGGYLHHVPSSDGKRGDFKLTFQALSRAFKDAYPRFWQKDSGPCCAACSN
jgi:hypothetical protein